MQLLKSTFSKLYIRTRFWLLIISCFFLISKLNLIMISKSTQYLFCLQGRLVYENYFSSSATILRSLVGIIQNRLTIPASPVLETPSPSVFNSRYNNDFIKQNVFIKILKLLKRQHFQWHNFFISKMSQPVIKLLQQQHLLYFIYCNYSEQLGLIYI